MDAWWDHGDDGGRPVPGALIEIVGERHVA